MPQARRGSGSGSRSSSGSSRRTTSSSQSKSTRARSSGGSRSKSGSSRSTSSGRSSSKSSRSTSRARPTRSASARSTRTTSSRGRSGSGVSGSAEAQLEAVAARLRKLNERIIKAGREAGESTLTNYEKALKTIATTIERGPGSSDIEWVANVASAQARFIRDMIAPLTSRARKALK